MTNRWETEDIQVRDDVGRTWRIYDYSVYAGKAERRAVGTGAQYRGFVPIDGGARRTWLMLSAEAMQPASRELLLEQLAKSKLYHRDDPAHCARMGLPVERTDKPD